MRSLRWILLVCFMGWLLAACAQQPIPTLIPTPTEIPPSSTPEPTATRQPLPTPQPTQFIPPSEAEDPTQQAYIRMVHATSAIGAVDVYIEGLNLVTGIEAGQYTEPTPIVAGEYQIFVTPAGGRSADGSIWQQRTSITGRQSLVLILTGTQAAPEVRVVNQDMSPLKANQSRITFFNAATGGAAVGLSAENGELLTPIVNQGNVSSAVAVEARFTTFTFWAGTVTLLNRPLRLFEYDNYFFILTGDTTNRESLQLIELKSFANGITTIRGLQLVDFEGSPVDLYIDRQIFGTAMGLGNDTAVLDIEAGVHELSVFTTGADPQTTDPLARLEFITNPSQRVLLLLVGTREDIQLEQYVEDVTPLKPNQARIAFISLVPDPSQVILDMGGDIQQQRVFYGRPTEGVLITAEPTSFNWQAESGEQLEFVDRADIVAGESYFYIFRASGTTESPFMLRWTVGTLTDVQVISTQAPTVTTLTPPNRLRIVNAAPGTFVEFRVDNQSVVSDLSYTYGNLLGSIQAGERVITAHDANGQLLARLIETFEAGKTYSVFFSGYASTGFSLFLVADDAPAAPANPTLRLVNLYEGFSNLGLAYASAQQTENPSDGIENPVLGITTDRQSIPIGTERIVSDIASGDVSEWRDTRIAGVIDLFVLDSQVGEIIATIPSLAPTAHTYEVVVIPDEAKVNIIVFFVFYE